MAGGDWSLESRLLPVGGGPMVDCWNLDDWEKENKDLVT